MDDLRRGRKSFREILAADLEILPLMNLFIVLIPMLLLSAVFIEISVIDMALPAQAEETEPEPEREPLALAVFITDEAYVIEGNGVRRRVIPRTGREDAEAETALGERLAAIARAHPDERSVRVVSLPRTQYAEIIAVMDIAREAGLPNAGLLAGTKGGEG